jgi:hypothetical protein
MKKIKIGIDRARCIHLRLDGDKLRIDDESNSGVIECTIANLKKTIRMIKHVYDNHRDLDNIVYGADYKTIQLSYYQDSIGNKVCRGNYIVISHMPMIIKMLKSVKVEKEKYILNKDSLSGLSIYDLEYLTRTMRRRRKIMIDDNGCKYIEV